MSADHRHQAFASAEAPFQLHARQALRAAIVHYGWDHPVVDAAQRSVLGIGQLARERAVWGCPLLVSSRNKAA